MPYPYLQGFSVALKSGNFQRSKSATKKAPCGTSAMMAGRAALNALCSFLALADWQMGQCLSLHFQLSAFRPISPVSRLITSVKMTVCEQADTLAACLATVSAGAWAYRAATSSAAALRTSQSLSLSGNRSGSGSAAGLWAGFWCNKWAAAGNVSLSGSGV